MTTRRRLQSVTNPAQIPDFEAIRAATGKAPAKIPACLLAFDPGETLGWSRATEGHFDVASQVGRVKFDDITQLLDSFRPGLLVIESYRLYPWAASEQSFSDFFTPRLIGAIEQSAFARGIPRVFQSAQQGKNFCTDSKLKAWGMWCPGLPHANDATRHLTAYLLFGKNLTIYNDPGPSHHGGE